MHPLHFGAWYANEFADLGQRDKIVRVVPAFVAFFE